MVRPPSPHGAPSFIGNSTHFLYIEAFSPLASELELWEELFMHHCNCNTLSHIGIKEDFGGRIGGLAKCVDAHVYEVILFYCLLLLYFG